MALNNTTSLKELEVPSNNFENTASAVAAPLSPATLRLCLWTICILGVLLNILVFRKYRSSRCRHSPSVRSSLQLLCVMAVADTVSLLALMLALGSQHLGGDRGWLLPAICKLDLFLIHASSAFGIWCWFVLSAVRYLAIHHPYTHLRLHKEPLLTVLCVAICCCLLEVWILFDVDFIEEAQVCGETLPEHLGKIFQLVEILWTYFLPLSMITILDLKVLCCQSAWRNPIVSGSDELPSRTELLRSVTTESGLDANGELSSPKFNGQAQLQQLFRSQIVQKSSGSIPSQNSKSRRRAQQLRILKRCLCISVIDLGMNLPNYLLRLYLTLASEQKLEVVAQSPTFLWLQDLSQLLYFAQFSMNALYLVAMNYVLPTKKRRSSPQQLLSVANAIQQQRHSSTAGGIPSRGPSRDSGSAVGRTC